jgi:hypothetical protein
MAVVLARAAAVWFGIMIIAVANGTLRVFVIVPLTGEAVGHIVSSLLLCVLVIFVASLTVRWIGAHTRRALFIAGGLWLALTLAFEFLAGHYVFGRSWEVLLANYDVLDGRVWILVLLATFLGPWLGAKLREELGRE